LTSQDWKARYDSISKFEQLVEEYPESIKQKLLPIFDGFIPRITDANSKVNLHALQTLAKTAAILKDAIAVVFSTLMPPLTSNLCSNKAEIRSASSVAIETIVSSVDNSLLVPQWVSIISNSNRKIQVPLLDKLSGKDSCFGSNICRYHA
jgi:hypothetical protein